MQMAIIFKRSFPCFNEIHWQGNKKSLSYQWPGTNLIIFTCKERIGATQKWPVNNTS